ncbi:unnamed protein product [Owenia fusiformis]|uniref:Autophagy-related protein 9 n=1 Tax=Owenia fusiformis TaxID=6347 RepID=A0A8J1TW14_OWEFU|nr:unnamed protein product [Owenia fusiformis]
MTEYQTGYQALGSFYDEDNDSPPVENIIHVVQDSHKSRWNHIENLDEFFTRVYQYHQRSGFACMAVADALQLIQFLFVVLFSVFLMNCVKYDVLFGDKVYDTTHKVTIPEAVVPFDQCVHSLPPILVICLIVAGAFWALRLIKVIYNVSKYYEIRCFYMTALKLSVDDMANMTWHEVQTCMRNVQKELQMCIHKSDLTELDIYHRILRFKNYEIAMVNKSLLSLKYRVPFIGEYAFLSTGLKYNLEMILFWGPYAPFESYWHLKPDFKNIHKRKDLADELSKKIMWYGVINLVLSPLIFLWQILYSFFRYAEVLKREPNLLGARRWSLYARLYLRHYNELDHEFDARLNRGHKCASRYMSIFTSPMIVVIAKFVAFFAGSILAVLVILTVIDEDVLAVEHVLSTMTILGVVVAICKSMIPDENMVWCPETLMTNVLAQVHYIPDSWKGNAHTFKVRDEFAQVFQYKAVYLLEELLSPLITPLVLLCDIRHKAQDIVDFYRNFTVEVTGVGDVCSFAQMDVRKHGNPQWVEEGETQANQKQQGEDGKTELSLMHFHLTNPEWKPPADCSLFLNNIKTNVQKDALAMTTLQAMQTDNPLVNSLHSMSSMGGGYNSIVCSVLQPNLAAGGVDRANLASVMSPPISVTHQGAALGSSMRNAQPRLRGGVSKTEGPLQGSGGGMLTSVNDQVTVSQIPGGSSIYASAIGSPTGGSPLVASNVNIKHNEGALEMLSTEMSFSALYMHGLHNRRLHGGQYESLDDYHARRIWQRQDSSNMPSILETNEHSNQGQADQGQGHPGQSHLGQSHQGQRNLGQSHQGHAEISQGHNRLTQDQIQPSQDEYFQTQTYQGQGQRPQLQLPLLKSNTVEDPDQEPTFIPPHLEPLESINFVPNSEDTSSRLTKSS